MIEASPESEQAEIYRRLARHIAGDHPTSIPKPLNGPALKDWAKQWGDRVFGVGADAPQLAEAV